MAGKIFINYRRDDEAGYTGRLFDRLDGAFSSERIFMDVDSIAPGHDFVRVLEEQVSLCDVILVVIGRQWLGAQDQDGKLRLRNPADFVRIEIEAALNLDKRIIPVLINNAQMPRPEELPETLRPLSRRNAVRVTHERFRADAQGLIKVLETALAEEDAARHAASVAEAREAQRRRDAEDVERQRQEQAKRQAALAAGLSAQDIAKAEELANWDFIKGRSNAQELRDHLARYPDGVTHRFARTTLDELVWASLGNAPTSHAAEAYLAEFPEGTHAKEALAIWRRANHEQVRRQQEIEDWAAANTQGDIAAFDAYIAKWPDNPNAMVARNRIRELKGPVGTDAASPIIFIALGAAALTWIAIILFAMSSSTPTYPPPPAAAAPAPAPAPPAPLFAESEGVVLVGPTSVTSKPDTVDGCRQRCTRDTRCSAFQFNRNTAACMTYTGSVATLRKGDAAWYSGVRR